MVKNEFTWINRAMKYSLKTKYKNLSMYLLHDSILIFNCYCTPFYSKDNHIDWMCREWVLYIFPLRIICYVAFSQQQNKVSKIYSLFHKLVLSNLGINMLLVWLSEECEL